uniref:Uncharacterized protein n=1 Tax=viral metagenome TaxID=1070528 RepID=A0A6H1ZZG8_9ZZZZ
MKEFNEMLKVAQECANEADALRTAVQKISEMAGKIAENIGSGYGGQNAENMVFQSGNVNLQDEGYTRRLCVDHLQINRGVREWQIGTETADGSMKDSAINKADEYFGYQLVNPKIVRNMSISELIFVIENIEGFLMEWYENLKTRHARRKEVRTAAEKIAASLK